MKLSRLSLIILLYLSIATPTHAQELAIKTEPLLSILTSIEKQFGVTFTYADKVIENIRIHPTSSLNLNETLQSLAKQTNLHFTFLTENNILISNAEDDEETSTICGYLFDNDSKQPIEGISIVAQNSKVSTMSNQSGFFSLVLSNKNNQLVFNHLAYPSFSVAVSDLLKNKDCKTLWLQQKVEKLNEIILQNYLTSGINIQTDNTIRIDIQNSGILPGLIEPDILQKIQALPGISSVNETISNINIRGGANDQNLLLWDDIKMYHSGHFFGLISAFNPYLINEVTIIKNGTNAQFNDAVSGTISIETHDQINENPFGGAGLNLLSTDAFAHIPLSEKLAVQFSGRRALTDVIHTPTFDNYFKKAFQNSKITNLNNYQNNEIKTNSDFSFHDYSFKLLYDADKNTQIRLSFLNVENQLFFNESVQTATVSDDKTSDLRQKNIAAGLKVLKKWNPHFRTEFHTYYTKYNIDAQNYSLFNEQRLIQQNEVLETGAKLNTFWQLNKNTELLNGYQYYELGITNAEDVNVPIFIRTIKKVIRNHSVYSQLNFVSSNRKTFINSGIRLNYIEKFGQIMAEPRFQALHKFSPNFSFKVAGEFKSQNATQIIDLQEDFLGVQKSRWVLADEKTIPILKSKQASVGFHYKRNLFLIDIEGFYKYVDGITTANQGFQNQHQYIKTTGSYNVKGIEFLINKKTSVYSIWLGYTFTKNDYHFPELSPSIFPNNLDIRHSISAGNTYHLGNFDLAFGLRWRTGKPHTIPNFADPVNTGGLIKTINYNEPNQQRLPNYFRGDISATYNFNITEKVHALAGVSFLNLFNNKNILNSYYKLDTENDLKEINNTSIETTPNFTFRVSF